MAEKNTVNAQLENEEIVDRAKDFWSRNGKLVLGIGSVLLLLVAGYYIYKNFFQEPNQQKAADAMFKAEEYYRMDSVSKALNGDGQYMGFLKIIDRYGSTDAGKLAKFYAGSCYIKLDDNANAVKYLKDFSTDAKQVQQRAYKLLGDAYADQGKNAEALESYKKAAHHFEEDQQNASEALFMAAFLAQKVMNNEKEAVALYTELKKKFPNTQYGYQADTYLAQLGVYNVN